MAEPASEASATMTVQQQQEQNGSAGTAGSPTAAQVGGESAQQETAEAPPPLTLRLRPRPSVTWGADVINNEGMGKKSSKRESGEGGGERAVFGKVSSAPPCFLECFFAADAPPMY